MNTVYSVQNPITGGLQSKISFLEQNRNICIVLSDQQDKNSSHSNVVVDTIQDYVEMARNNGDVDQKTNQQ